MSNPSEPTPSPIPSHTLAGRVAIVTGASRGIGRAVASRFAAQGAAVALAARDAAALTTTASAIIANGGQALAIPTDVADEASVAALYAQTTATLGPPTILINCAGALVNTPFADLSAAAWDHILAVNLRGVFLCCRAAFHAMRPQGGGVIINIASLAGVPNVEKFPGLSAYTASKFAVAGLTESLAVEGRPHNIRALAVSPGAVDTEMLRAAAPHLNPGMTPDQFAAILLLLVSDAAAPLTGLNLPIFSNA